MSENAGKIATDIMSKTAEMGKSLASIAQNPENAGKIATDIMGKAGKSAVGSVTKTAQQGQGI